MRATLLGTANTDGVPVPFCDPDNCKYCSNTERLRSALLVETEESTLLLDAGPDLKKQLEKARTTNLDAVFITHMHFDHMGGLRDLGTVLAHLSVDIYMSSKASVRFGYEAPHVADTLEPEIVEYGDTVEVGDLEVVAFPVDHARPEFETLGFSVYQDGSKLVYAPDMERFLPEKEAGKEYRDADLLFAEGSGIVDENIEFSERLRSSLRDADAGKTVLVHLNEHYHGMTTKEMVEEASKRGYELGEDFGEYTV